MTPRNRSTRSVGAPHDARKSALRQLRAALAAGERDKSNIVGVPLTLDEIRVLIALGAPHDG